MRDILTFYKQNLEKLKDLARDCPDCIQLAMPCTHYDYLKRYIKELEDLPPFDHEKFDAFYQAYPVKKGRATAVKAWGKIKMDGQLYERIMVALEAQKKMPQWTKDGGQFIPHPASWLNQERWEDEVKVQGQGSTKYKNT